MLVNVEAPTVSFEWSFFGAFFFSVPVFFWVAGVG